MKHLDEIKNGNYFALYSLPGVNSLQSSFNSLITSHPGFAADIFLKRANLFFALVNNYTGIWDDEMDQLIVPADYQVPKMLRYFGVLDYSSELENDVFNCTMLPSGSLKEVEIRASTIVACNEIAKRSNKSIANVDYFLWGNRKACSDPFHLTITTDY